MPSSQPTLASEVPMESPLPRKWLAYFLRPVYSMDASIDATFPKRQIELLLMRSAIKTDILQTSGCKWSRAWPFTVNHSIYGNIYIYICIYIYLHTYIYINSKNICTWHFNSNDIMKKCDVSVLLGPSTGEHIYIYIYIYISECHIFNLFRCVLSFLLCYTGEALEGPISTGISNKLNNIDSNNGILISKNTILYIYYVYIIYILLNIYIYIYIYI